MSDDGLGRFFEHMRPFLLGRMSAEELEQTLGPSPTGTANLAFYPTFLRRHERLQLMRQFQAVHRLVEEHSALDWAELVGDFIQAHVPGHWSMYRTGEPFADWLTSEIEAGRPVPAEAPMLADFAWICWLARNAPPDAGLDETVHVRQYPFDVAAFTRAILADPKIRPEPTGPRALVVYRHLETGDARHFTPSLATLAVLDHEAGGSGVDWDAHGVGERERTEERARLVQRGVLR